MFFPVCGELYCGSLYYSTLFYILIEIGLCADVALENWTQIENLLQCVAKNLQKQIKNH